MTDSAFDDYTPPDSYQPITHVAGDEVYHGTRGFSGSSSSEEAAYADLVNGVTNVTQKLVLILAAQAGPRGITVAEVREKNGKLHHGRISSALTKQHIAGKLVALHERRGHCGVYVLPEFVNGRTSRPYHRRKAIDPEVIRGILLAHRYGPGIVGVNALCQCGWNSTNAEPSHVMHQAEKIAEALNG